MVTWYWSVAILFWQRSIDHIVNVQYKRCVFAKTRLRHPSLPFDSLPTPPVQSVEVYARSITWQPNEKRLTPGWPYSMSMGLCPATISQKFCNALLILACEQQTHFRSSLLSLRKITSANPSGKTISVTWNLFYVGRSDERIEYSSSDSSRPSALACLGIWRELPNTLWNANFTTFTRFPAT